MKRENTPKSNLYGWYRWHETHDTCMTIESRIFKGLPLIVKCSMRLFYRNSWFSEYSIIDLLLSGALDLIFQACPLLDEKKTISIKQKE